MNFIEDCHQWWRFASVRVAMLAGLIVSWLAADPQMLANLAALVPPQWSWLAGFIVFAVPTIARLIRQPSLPAQGPDAGAAGQPLALVRAVPATKTPAKDGAKLTALIGGAAATLLVSSVARWEGKRNDPYRDIVGVQTVCYGDTKVAMRRYSDAECEAMLRDRLVDYAAPVLARNPELEGHPPQLAAATSLAYNIGTSAYQRSTVARLFSAGRWKDACNGFLAWRMAGGKVVRGLVNRRQAERALCLTGLK